MDFSALLNKEIAKKKAEAESVAKESKYLRRGEVERERERKYEEEQEEARRKREEKLKREREQEEEEREQRKRKRGRRVEEARDQQEMEEEKGVDEDLPDLDKQEVKSRLRQLDEPVTIFGESDNARIRRLLKAEKKQQKKTEIERENALLGGDRAGLMIEPQNVRDDQETVNLQVRAYLKFLIAKWELVLKDNEATSDNEAYQILRQTDESVTILLNKLRKQSLHEDVFASLATLTMHLQQRDYRQANDTYIKMSIGNAAWPIGVTAVGIHARSAQDKITGKDQVANIMKSEDTRKWLTAVKRLITFAEGHQISL
jgi:pre-mRNA-splicing factor 18